MPNRIPIVHSPVVCLSHGCLNVLARHRLEVTFSYDRLPYFLEEKLCTAQVSSEEKGPSRVKQ